MRLEVGGIALNVIDPSKKMSENEHNEVIEDIELQICKALKSSSSSLSSDGSDVELILHSVSVLFFLNDLLFI